MDSIDAKHHAENDIGSTHMNSVSIKAGLTGLFALLTLLIGGLGYLAITSLSNINQNTEVLANRWLPSADLIGQITANSEEIRYREGEHILSTPAELAEIEKELATIDGVFRQTIATYDAVARSEAQQRSYDEFRAKWTSYQQLHQRMLELSRANNKEEASKLYRGEMKALFGEVDKIAHRMLDTNRQGRAEAIAQARNEYESARSMTFIVLGIAFALAIGAMAFSYLAVAQPIEMITQSMEALANGNLSTEVPFAERRNEIGAMAGAVQVFKTNLMHAREVETDAETAKATAETERKRAMTEMADRFERTVGAIVTTVSDAAAELQAAAQALSSSSSQTTHQSTVVAAASEQAAANVRTVAAAAEELSGSVREISRQVSMSSTIARKAVEEAEQTNEQVSGLSVGAQKIGAIVDLINDIASKTNLLALNATIEAARAGEAGRGFAVVAQEVKALAEQTGKATAEITSHIASVQSATDQAANAILGIGKTIDEINQIAAGIAAAVEEQGAATEEIARNVDQAAHGTTEVTRNITGVNQAAESSSASANQVLSAATELSSQSDKLRAEMQRFLATVRAA